MERTTASKVQVRALWLGIPMASSIDKTQTIAQPASGSSGNETARGRSIATRLTDAEFAEVEAAAGVAGKKVGEWLREAALAQARGTHYDEQTDQILLAELMGMRSLMLNLFARASEGPLTTDDYLVATKRLPARRIGGRVLIPVSDLRQYARFDHPERIAG
jgi:hypothetical protein